VAPRAVEFIICTHYPFDDAAMKPRQPSTANASHRTHPRASLRVSSIGRPAGALVDPAVLQVLM